MLPGTYNLNLYRGDTTRFEFVLWQDSGKTIPFSLSGATPRAQIRDRPDSAEIIVELVCVVAGVNKIDVTVPANGSGLLKAKGTWDLQLTWGSGEIQTVLAGAVTVMADVTRSS